MGDIIGADALLLYADEDRTLRCRLRVHSVRLPASRVRDAAPLSLVVTDLAGAQLAAQLPTLGALAASLPSTPWLDAPCEILVVVTAVRPVN